MKFAGAWEILFHALADFAWFSPNKWASVCQKPSLLLSLVVLFALIQRKLHCTVSTMHMCKISLGQLGLSLQACILEPRLAWVGHEVWGWLVVFLTALWWIWRSQGGIVISGGRLAPSKKFLCTSWYFTWTSLMCMDPLQCCHANLRKGSVLHCQYHIYNFCGSYYINQTIVLLALQHMIKCLHKKILHYNMSKFNEY